MADIVIRGLDMPRPIAGEAGYVDFRIFSDGTAIMASAKPPYYKQFEAVALPEGHGRLIDAERFRVILCRLKERQNDDVAIHALTWAIECLDKLDTIVPAEGGNADG